MQTENKWLNEVDNLDRIDEHPALAGVLANIGRAAVQTARAGGKAVATAARATGRLRLKTLLEKCGTSVRKTGSSCPIWMRTVLGTVGKPGG